MHQKLILFLFGFFCLLFVISSFILLFIRITWFYPITTIITLSFSISSFSIITFGILWKYGPSFIKKLLRNFRQAMLNTWAPYHRSYFWWMDYIPWSLIVTIINFWISCVYYPIFFIWYYMIFPCIRFIWKIARSIVRCGIFTFTWLKRIIFA